MALLTSCLAFQKKEYDLALRAAVTERVRNGKEMVDFNSVDMHNTISVPRIYYCSRTHSQLQQVVGELRGVSEEYLARTHVSVLVIIFHTHIIC